MSPNGSRTVTNIVIGPCFKVRDLGEGAFAKVVECQVTRGGKPEPCAVKLLKPALFDSNQDVTDFIKEGVVLRKITSMEAVPETPRSDG